MSTHRVAPDHESADVKAIERRQQIREVLGKLH
jgi:hypothetical protein